VSQDPRAARHNQDFFLDRAAYREQVADLDTYRRIRATVDRELIGVKRMLDVGNGGVFDYDVSLVPEIVAVDLFLDELPRDAFPPNVEPRRGDALALPVPDESFDGIVIVSVLHHLVGRSAGDLVPNARQALSEAARALVPGGKLVLMESCVPRWFVPFERWLLFPTLSAIAGTRLMAHPATFQLASATVARLLEERFRLERIVRIDTGRWMLQLGHRWPTALTPARPYLFVGRRS
jgi:SAM-dependent methyltransferase